MILLAGIEGNLVFLIVAAAVGVINWLMEKKKKARSDSPNPPAAPRQTTTSSGADSEQERLRRFMEALGVPQPQQQQPPPRQAPATAKPQAPQRTVVRTRDRQQQIARPAPKPIRRPAQPVFSEPEEMTRAGRLEEAATSIERISGEFDKINVRVAMPSVQTPAGPAKNAGTTSVLEREGNPLVASLRRTLTNPTDIRAAFLAAELLGKPRGLQG